MANSLLSRTLSRKGSRALSRKPSDKGSWFESITLIDNTKSLAFDGSNDKLVANYQLPSNFTVSYWINRSAAGTRYAFDARDSGNTSAIYVHTSDEGSGYKLVSNAFDDSSEISINAWHNIVITYNSSASEGKLYVDGSLDNTKGSVSLGTAASQLTIGTRYTNFAYLQGNLDEFSVWDTALDADTVAAIYNSGTPIDLSTDGGDYASSGDLKLWYRMGDATEPVADGSGWNTNNKFVFDQVGTSLDSEMVISDPYNSDNWYVYSGNTMTFGDNFMRCERTASGDSHGWFTYLRGSDEANSILFSTPTNGSWCLLTFDVETDDPDAYVMLRINNTNSHFLQGTGNGTKTIVYKKNAYTDYLEGKDLSQGKYIKISNVSVKKIFRTLGEELLTGFTNGSTYPFDTFSSSGTSITSAIETSGNWGGAASNSFNISSGKVYKVTFDLTYNSGSDTLRVVFADNANGAATQRSDIYYTNSNGVNTTYLTATATDATAHLQIGTWHSSDVVNFSASNISVKEVSMSSVAEMTNMDSSDIETESP